MAVPRVAGKRHLLALSLLSLLARPVLADDDEEDNKKFEIAIGEKKTAVYNNKITAYGFKGKAGDIVTIRFSGKRAKQMGVVMIESDEHIGEWITGHSSDSFAATGNVRDGETLRLQLRLPKTALYHVHLDFDRDTKSAFGQGDTDLSYSIAVDGASAPGKAYVRGSVGFLLGYAAGDITPYGVNATLSVGQQRTPKTGVEGMLSASFLPADSLTLMGMLGVGVRFRTVEPNKVKVSSRVAVGLMAMTGVQDGLGAAARLDTIIGKFGYSIDLARVGRANIGLISIGVAF